MGCCLLRVPSGWGVVLLLAGLLASVGCMTGSQVLNSTRQFPAGTGFVQFQVESGGRSEAVWVFVPHDYDPSHPTPTVVFLHGLFEAGRSGNGHLAAGLGPAIARDPKAWPFLTIFPRSNGTWKGPERAQLVMQTLSAAKAHFNIDSERVILAGLSYGALGTWEIAAAYPGEFAALVPVSGHRATEIAERVAMLPVWAFAYSGDLIVSSSSSEEMVKVIAAHGGASRLTEFPGIGHDGWGRAVAEAPLVEWMLQQRRPVDRPTPRINAVADLRD